MPLNKDDGRVKLRVYRIPVRTPVRILLNYDGAVRPLLWFAVGTDGSVYLGLSRPTGSVGYSGGQANPAGEASLRYSDVKEISDPEFCKRIHLSFHSSGIVKVGEKRGGRASWRSLTVCHQLCLFVFEHPSHFPPARGARKRDFVLKYPVDEAPPIEGKIFVTHPGEVVGLENVIHQTRLVFNIIGLEIPPMQVELVLGHRDLAEPWPPRTIMAWALTSPMI